MRDRPLTIATYAAGASLAAVTLVYVFGPTFFLDDDAGTRSKASRKKGVVGLINMANDCFINSVLQVLAGLPELRAHLIREVHRRKLDGPDLYRDPSAGFEEEKRKQGSKKIPEWQHLALQQGVVTEGLKEVLDALNERPIYRKTVSAAPFIRVLETAFRTRINRSQQDAQEFLQIVIERLSEEHFAGKRVRKRAEQAQTNSASGRVNDDATSLTTSEQPGDGRQNASKGNGADGAAEPSSAMAAQVVPSTSVNRNQDEDVFPMEGRLESQVECTFCHFKPKPTGSSFLSLTLHVPHDETATSLDACFDGLFKVEHIDDFVCDKCRLDHALSIVTKQLSKSALPDEERATLESHRHKIEAALLNDPEKSPKDVDLQNLSTVPKRRITKHSSISVFPQILAIHLSRSVWDPHSVSTKNMAKVSFAENLRLGGLLDRKNYRLLGVVTHKGGHNSGHYESFRRQILNAPFSTPNSMGTEGIYTVRPSPTSSAQHSAAPSPYLNGTNTRDLHIPTPTSLESPISAVDSQFPSSIHAGISSSATSSASSISGAPPNSITLDKRKQRSPDSVPLDAIPTPGLPDPPSTLKEEKYTDEQGSRSSSVATHHQSSRNSLLRGRSLRHKGGNERWWRISDEKVKESKTSEVLSMQREVYLLFYELMPTNTP